MLSAACTEVRQVVWVAHDFAGSTTAWAMALALTPGANGGHCRLAGHPAVDSHLMVGRIDPDVRVIRRQRASDTLPRAGRAFWRCAAPRTSGPRPGWASSSARRPSMSRRRARALAVCEPAGVVAPPAWRQKRREVRPGPHLRNLDLDRAYPPVSRPASGSRCDAGALRRPFVPVRTTPPGDFRLHQRLRRHPDALPQHLHVLVLEELVNERREISSGVSISVNTSVWFFCGHARTHGQMRDGAFCRLLRGPSTAHQVR